MPHNGIGYKNDTWWLRDGGATWMQVTASSGWSARMGHISVVLPDGSIVLMGGEDINGNGITNDVWRLIPTGSSAQNPSHTYNAPGTYQVALQVSNTEKYNSTRKIGYITVLPQKKDNIAIFRPLTAKGYLDYNKTGIVDKAFHFGTTGDIPVVGDWDGNGVSDVGVFRSSNGNWYLETTKTGVVNKTFHFGTAGDIPVVVDWNNDGTTNVGVFRSANGNWYLDTTKTGVVNTTFHFGTTGDTPLVGQWSPLTFKTIHIRNNNFVPSILTVLPRAQITWINNDEIVHSLMMKESDGGFNSGDIIPGAQWSYTFGTRDGTYTISDLYHPEMKGTIIVKAQEA